MKKKMVAKCMVVAVCMAALLSGCGFKFGKFPTYFDDVTYKSLTDAKADVLFLYASFGEPVLDMDEINGVRLNIARLHEYEKGKGAANAATARQIGLIANAFADHVKNRMSKVAWTPFDMEDFKENIAEYFDIAIKTERSKNKKWKK